jgi:hypothetical protein
MTQITRHHGSAGPELTTAGRGIQSKLAPEGEGLRQKVGRVTPNAIFLNISLNWSYDRGNRVSPKTQASPKKGGLKMSVLELQ